MRFLSFLLLCLIGAAASARAELDFAGRMPEDLMPGLRRVLQTALEQADPILESGALMEEAKGRRISARSAVLPSFRTSVALRQEEDQDAAASSGFEERVVYNVTLSQPLYHWGARQNQKEIGELQYELESLNQARTREQVVAKVRSDYMDLVVVRQEMQRSSEALDAAEADLAFQERQIEAGAASRSSLERYELAVERAKLAHLRNLTDWDGKLGALALYVSMDTVSLEALLAEEVAEPRALTFAELASVERFFKDQVAEDERMKRSALDIEIEERRLAIESKGNRPRVDAQVGLTSNAVDLDGVRREREYAFFGLVIDWNIFDGFRTKGRTLEAASRLGRSHRAREALEDALAREYYRLARQVEIAARALDIEERVFEAASEEVERARQAYADQRLSEADFERAEREFQQAFVRVQRSRIDYLDMLSRLSLELGVDPMLERRAG